MSAPDHGRAASSAHGILLASPESKTANLARAYLDALEVVRALREAPEHNDGCVNVPRSGEWAGPPYAHDMTRRDLYRGMGVDVDATCPACAVIARADALLGGAK